MNTHDTSLAPSPVVMVCTVGGSPAPIRASIEYHKPSHVIYVASPASRETIRPDIEKELAWDVRDTHTITLTDYQDLVQCVADMRRGIPVALEAMSLPVETRLLADITGGTKIMSAALTLVMMEFNSHFSYVGGEARDKNGLGVVTGNGATVMRQFNPWDVLALKEARILAYSFNHAQFTDALDKARLLAERISDPQRKNFYGGIVDMVRGYMLWDGFDYKVALVTLRQAAGRITPFAAGSPGLGALLRDLNADVQRLDALLVEGQALRGSTPPERADLGRRFLLDLLANAQRRADEGHYDDAVARLYSAIEKTAKIALWARHGINNSHVDVERMPESIREELRPMADADGVARIGLQKSYALLASLGNALGAAYMERRQELERQLEARNTSLLAHGFEPIGAGKYQKLLCIALDFLHATADDLPVFPQLDWKALLL